MASLGVTGDPDGWQDAAGAISAIVGPLQDEVNGVDTLGGTGLTEHWAGPVADRYQEVWRQRHQRYQDLLHAAGRLPGPIDTFGGQLRGYQQRARQMETHYTGHGLHLTLDGMRFQLPPSHPSLPQELKSLLEGLLMEAERDVDNLWADIRNTVGNLARDLQPLAGDLEDLAFALSPIGIFWAGRAVLDWAGDTIEAHRSDVEMFDHVVLDPVDKFADVLEEKNKDAIERIRAYRDTLEDVEKKASDLVEHDDSALARSIRDDAATALEDANRNVADLDAVKWGGRVAAGAGIAITGIETYQDVRKKGWVSGLEDNAGGWAAIGVGLALGVALGPGLGAIAIGAVVSIGVGWAVQHEVDAHRKSVTKALTGAGNYLHNQFDPAAS